MPTSSKLFRPLIHPNAPYLFVLDFPTSAEWVKGQTLTGSPLGHYTNEILHDANIPHHRISFIHAAPLNYRYNPRKYATEVERFIKECNPADGKRIQQNLHANILRLRPGTVFGGELALRHLTPEKSISKWRGSQLELQIEDFLFQFIPTHPPAQVVTIPEYRYRLISDLKRGQTFTFTNPHKSQYKIKPTFGQVREYLAELYCVLTKQSVLVSIDVETLWGFIECLGIYYAPNLPLSIPFMTKENPKGYFPPEEEKYIRYALVKIFRHPNLRATGQNFSYDQHYILQEFLSIPKLHLDSMLLQHVLDPGEPKSLPFICSLHNNHYIYWKDDLKDYRSYPDDENKFWNYNCQDIDHTLEAACRLRVKVREENLRLIYNEVLELSNAALKMSIRGVRIDENLRAKWSSELQLLLQEYQSWFESLRGPLTKPKTKKAARWYDSDTQLRNFFYQELGLAVQLDKHTGRPSAGDQALKDLAALYPYLKHFFQRIQEYRSLKKFLNDFIRAPLDHGRLKSHFTFGPETFRLSSKKNPFGFGVNLQTLSKGTQE